MNPVGNKLSEKTADSQKASQVSDGVNKAVIETGGKQYIVSAGDTLDVELLKDDNKTVIFDPLLVFSDKGVKVGNPLVKNAKVSAEIVEPKLKGKKTTAIRFKAKKRVNKIQGHRQNYTKIKISKIE